MYRIHVHLLWTNEYALGDERAASYSYVGHQIGNGQVAYLAAPTRDAYTEEDHYETGICT